MDSLLPNPLPNTKDHSRRRGLLAISEPASLGDVVQRRHLAQKDYGGLQSSFRGYILLTSRIQKSIISPRQRPSFTVHSRCDNLEIEDNQPNP